MPDDWEGHPARKDYPVQIKMTPKVYEPLQLTAEEFAANVRQRNGRSGSDAARTWRTRSGAPDATFADGGDRAAPALRGNLGPVLEAAQAVLDALPRAGKVLIFGNGGSAAERSIWRPELVGRFHPGAPGAGRVALTTDTSILTSVANDYSFRRSVRAADRSARATGRRRVRDLDERHVRRTCEAALQSARRAG